MAASIAAPLAIALPAFGQSNVTVFGILDTYLDHSSKQHSLSTRTMLYAGVARIRNEAKGRFGINGNTGAGIARQGPGSVFLFNIVKQ